MDPRALFDHRVDVMPVQKYNIRYRQAESNGLGERWWSLNNAPVLGPNGEVTAIIHRVEDVTNIVHLRREDEASDQILPTREAEIRERVEADLRDRKKPLPRFLAKNKSK